MSSDPTSGRQFDLARSREQVANAVGAGLEDVEVANDRPIGDVTAQIVRWLGWA
jgi:hypothetical protein